MAWQNAGWASEQAATEPGTVQFKGFINVPGDFPLLDNRDIGDMYKVNNDVTDPYPPGQSFLAGQEIRWLGSLWTISDSELIWKDDTSTISKINSTRDVDVSNGLLIADTLGIKDASGLTLYNSSSQTIATIDDTTKNITLENGLFVKGDITVDESTTDSKIIIQDSTSGSFPNLNFLSKTGAFGVSVSINAIPGASTTGSNTRFNPNVNTTGDVRVQFSRGNGTPSDVNCQVGGNIDSYFNYLVGNVGIGTDTPLEKFDVTGNIKQNGAVTGAGSQVLADEASITLSYFGNTDACYGEVFIISDPPAKVSFLRSTNNTITFELATAGIFSTTDLDDYFVVYNVSNVLTLKNRLGVSRDIIYRVYRSY